MSLDAYLVRIGYAGSREPTLAALRGIVAGHATSIPFENVDVLLGRGASLAEDALADKMVTRRRGGYCFEHDTLLLRALAALGFAVEGLAARVLWGRADPSPGPRTHMLLRVTLPDGIYLADVGFGGLTLTAPIRFETGIEQETPHEPHRLVARDGEIELQAWLDGDWTPLYRASPVAQAPVDYEVGNWFTSTHPNSLFTNNLMCARPDPDCRYALLNDRFTVRRLGSAPERRMLGSAGELGEVLARDFHLPTPAEDVARVWAKIAGK
ncbi:MAG TPA: arylamine N-acetyltransferase [Stellaceae bacterium]|jgi:N-hydroxyarylamine O-acetyltransferase|nr:arylamine N-acetyltransferase [Stellaceae bacterium]